jgi:D-lactate dehydrogenase
MSLRTDDTPSVLRRSPAAAQLLAEVGRAAPGRVHSRVSDRLAMAHDASHFLLTPTAVVAPDSAAQVAALLAVAARHDVPITFRSGGTSLSGQGVTDGILVDTRAGFRAVTVLDGGARVRVQPGATVRQVNARLAPHGRKLGPDPASESACTIGGVIANNSSGMACGTQANTYRTLESMVMVLPSGTVIDSAAPDADAQLRRREPALHEGLLRLRDRIRGNPESVREIARQYALKNTMGYGLNAFVDHTEPVDVLTRLVIGSEGTLAFVAEATFRTLEIPAHAATGLLLFPGLRAATDALPDLVASGLATIELLDAASLRVAQLDPGAGDTLRTLTVAEHAGLLVEFQELDPEHLTDRCAAVADLLGRLPLALPAALTSDPGHRAALWHIRKGLYAAVAGARPSGTTALLEDVAVPVPALADTCTRLVGLFDAHGFENSVVFGHAKDGNIHFMLNERFTAGGSRQRYVDFTEQMVDLVLGHGGTLKAEHGTGRMMAPFVRRQFGDELYAVMQEVKRLCDPRTVLSPGVLLNEDPTAHIAHLKTTPTVEPEVDRCVECGFCEPVCPSRDLTLTPRQRIVLRRERARAAAAGDRALVAELDRDYAHDGIATCATDGMCQTACPVLIDTGQLVKRLRAQDVAAARGRAWLGAARHWDRFSRGASAVLTVAARLPEPAVRVANAAARRVLGDDVVPLWSSDLPRGGPKRPVVSGGSRATAVYFPACIGSVFGPAADSTGVGPAFLALCRRAGVDVSTPTQIQALCCGTPWKSKGLTAGHREMARRVLPALWEATRHGVLPVICDATSCTEGLTELVAAAAAPYSGLRVVDAVTFVDADVLPKLTVSHPVPALSLHLTCSSTRLGLNPALSRVAAAVADDATVPDGWGCCGFAGDRGLLHPELTAAATRAQAASVNERSFAAYASANRTCELGLTRATGHSYQHVLEHLERATRPQARAKVRTG